MNTTAIMTDSNSGITPSEAHKLGIFSIPMPIIIDGDVFYEGIDITQEEFFDKLTSGCRVSTSQPSPGDVIDMWNNILAAGYKEIVYVPMSSGLSASCKSATALSMEFNGKVHIADNHRISVTQRQSVFDALELANSGATGAEIKSALEATPTIPAFTLLWILSNILKEADELPQQVRPLAQCLILSLSLQFKVSGLTLFPRSVE